MGLLKSLAKRVLGREEKKPVPAPARGEQPVQKPAEGGAEATDKPWYLDGQQDGWETTDVEKG